MSNTVLECELNDGMVMEVVEVNNGSMYTITFSYGEDRQEVTLTPDALDALSQLPMILGIE